MNKYNIYITKYLNIIWSLWGVKVNISETNIPKKACNIIEERPKWGRDSKVNKEGSRGEESIVKRESEWHFINGNGKTILEMEWLLEMIESEDRELERRDEE